MRILPFIALSLPLALSTACAMQDATPDEAAASAEISTPTKITITAGEPPALVAYREVNDPVWHAAEQRAATRFIASVRGPYWLTVVCTSDIVFNGALVGHNVDISRIGNTLGDGAQLTGFCAKPAPATRDVSGHMKQAGGVMIASNSATSATDDWTFQIPVVKGTYTLYAASADRIVIRRGLQATRSVVIAPIDTDVEGNLLAPAAFTVSNGTATRAVVRVSQQASLAVGQVFLGPADAARAIPNTVLTPDDNQTVSLQALSSDSAAGFTRTTLFASRRPWKIGDDPSFTFPAPFTDPQWLVDGHGDDVAAWGAVPTFVVFFLQRFGAGVDPSTSINDTASVSPSFVAQALINQVEFDTQIPGFLDAWRIDRSQGYGRSLIAQHADLAATEQHTIDTTSLTDNVPPPALTAQAAATPDIRVPAIPGVLAP